MPKKKLLNVTVRKRRWARGGKKGPSLMRNKDGNQCCLGFVGRACGYTPAELETLGYPEDVVINAGKNLFPVGIVVSEMEWSYNSDLAADLIRINDDEGIDDTERIERLTVLGREAGINFTFV